MRERSQLEGRLNRVNDTLATLPPADCTASIDLSLLTP
jgi:hypothetical protein